MPDDAIDASSFEAARAAGVQAAEEATTQAPEHPLLSVSWAQGFGQVDQVRAAVQRARTAGFTWKQIAEATGEHWETARTKYGSGLERMRRYRERKQADGD